MAEEVVDSSITVVDDSPASSSARTEPTSAAVEQRADINAASKRILRSVPFDESSQAFRHANKFSQIET